MSTPTLKEQVQAMSRTLHERIGHVAVAAVTLEAVRSDPSAPSEAISRAAVDFRQKESEMNAALAELVELEKRALREVAVKGGES